MLHSLCANPCQCSPALLARSFQKARCSAFKVQKIAPWINCSALIESSVLWHCWLGGRKGIHTVQKLGDGGGRHCLVRMEWRPGGWLVSASVNLPLHHKVQKFSFCTSSPGSPRKRAVKRLWWWLNLRIALSIWIYAELEDLKPVHTTLSMQKNSVTCFFFAVFSSPVSLLRCLPPITWMCCLCKKVTYKMAEAQKANNDGIF